MTAYDVLTPAVEFVMLAALSGMILAGVGFLTLPMLFLAQRLRGPQTLRHPAYEVSPLTDLPDVLIQLPVFNEPAVVVRLLDSVAELDWPADKLHIQLLDDSTDHTSEIAKEKSEQLTRRGLHIEHVCRDHRAGFKAEALAAGLARNNSAFVAMLDADFRPPADWLRAVMPRLLADPHAGFVQSRCEFANAGTNWLTRVQGLLFDAHFVMEQSVRARAGLLFQFNGTAAVWRRSAIDDAGGWSGSSLCEDLDLTIRAALAGWHGIFAMDPVVRGLVPEQIGHWRVQQRRWAMGFAQIARKLLGAVWKSDWSLAQKVSVGFLLLYQAFLPITAVALGATLVDLALRGGDFSLARPLVLVVALMTPIVAVSMTLPPYLALRRGTLIRYLSTLAMLPPLIVYLAFANMESILAAFLGRGDAFHRTPKEEAAPLRGEPVSP